MKFWLLRIIQVAGLVLLLVALSSALFPPTVTNTNDIQLNLALRQIGHEYLREVGDSTSLIPPVQQFQDGSHLLRLNAFVSYDTLIQVANRILASRYEPETYSIVLEDPDNGEVFLGSLGSVLLSDSTLDNTNVPCLGRDQEIRYANVRFSFHETTKSNDSNFLLLGGMGLLCLLLLPVSRRFIQTEAASSASAPLMKQVEDIKNNHLLSLGATGTLEEATQTLCIGKTINQLTYRESKLLAYFAARPNEILKRTDIHDSVWGEEGLITGRSLDVFVSRLRKKLVAATDVEIRTVHGVGYQFLIK